MYVSIASPYVDKFLTGMETSGRSLYNSVIGHVKTLDPGQSGQYNADVIGGINLIMLDFFSTPTYEARVQTLINAMPKISTAVTQSLSKKFKADPPEDFITEAVALQDIYTNQLEASLDDQAVIFEVVDTYINDLFTAIASADSLDTSITRTKKLQDSLFSYFVTKVTTVLEQYERELLALWSEYFEVTRWRYDNPVDKRTRDFCSDHAGGEYTQEEIESWADEEWDGKIPGTTPETIWVNLGGYNCRGTLTPIPNKK